MSNQKNDGQLPLSGIQRSLRENQGPRPHGMPSLSMIQTELVKLGLTQDSDAEALYDSWLASGFRLKNGNRIKDWKAAARNWHRNGWFPSQKNRRSTVLDNQQAERRAQQFKKIKDHGSH